MMRCPAARWLGAEPGCLAALRRKMATYQANGAQLSWTRGLFFLGCQIELQDSADLIRWRLAFGCVGV